jgi:hypothetical protein
MINSQATPDPSHLQGRGRSARRTLRTNGPKRRNGAWRDGDGGWLDILGNWTVLRTDDVRD